MINSMKKRTKQKIKKLIPKIYFRTLYIIIPVFVIAHAIDSFIRLHNGAPLKDLESRKYSPVDTELLIITIASMLLLGFLKVLVKISLLPFILICIVVFGLIGWFGYWAYEYTLQDPVQGFIELGIIISAVAALMGIMLWYESYKKRDRKKLSKNEASK